MAFAGTDMRRGRHPMLATATLSLATAAIAMAGIGRAADISKANNTTSLNLGASWTGTVAPTASDVALFDSTFAQGAVTTGTSVAWGGLRVTTGTSLVDLSNQTANAFIGTGSQGIDLSTSARSLGINQLQLLDNQTWNIAAGRRFSIGGATNN